VRNRYPVPGFVRRAPPRSRLTGPLTTPSVDTPITVDVASFSIVGQAIGLEWANLYDPATFDIDGQSIALTIGTPIAVDAAIFDIDGQSVAFNTSLAVTQAAIAPAGQTIVLNNAVTVEAASFDIDGQTVAFNIGHAVDKADPVFAGQTFPLNIGLVIDAAAFSIAGQDVTLTLSASGFTLAVDSTAWDIDGQAVLFDTKLAVTQAGFSIDGATFPLNVGLTVARADFQPDGQAVAFDSAVALVSVGIQPAGQDITLTLTGSQSVAVDAAAFSAVGQDIGLTVSGVTEEVTGGGWPLAARKRAILRGKRKKDRDKEQDELADEIERLEEHLGIRPAPSEDIRRIREMVRAYQREAEEILSNRAKRAFSYAERARTEQAWMLAMREYEKAQQEEELAVLLALSLD
jgi:hypothetical protein